MRNYNYDIEANVLSKKYYSENTIIKSKDIFNSNDKYQVKKIAFLHNNSCSTIEDVEELAKDNILNGDTNFSIHYTGNLSDLDGISDKIKYYTDSFDSYKAYSIKNCTVSPHGYNKNVDVDFIVEYLVTNDQESWVNEKVDSILQNIIRDSMTQAEKEKAIHDYIVANVAYDETAAKYSAYDALHDGTSVCQGYALLACKMLNKAGIENKIVYGWVNGSSENKHIWNLVNLNGKWYQLDCTWDDPIPDVPKRVCYDYYNLTDDKLAQNHGWDREKYPRAYTQYDLSTINIPVKAVKLNKHRITLKIGETTLLAANVLPSNASDNLIKWKYDKQEAISFDGRIMKGLKPGVVYINAVSDDGKFKDTCVVTVINEITDQVDMDDSIQMQEKNNVDKNKSWKIKFNKNIGAYTANKDNVYVLDEFNNRVDINVKFDVNRDTLIVKPLKSYTSGKTYHLIINRRISSDSGKKMIKPVVMKFTIE
nr:transglutaminase domain-containing protein [Clostridium muellerianum]